MPWSTSQHRAELPKDWHKRRARTWRAAAGQCQATTNDVRCTWTGRLNGDGGQCDHITRGAGHEQTNLQWLCPRHHAEKTNTESLAARTAHTRTRRPPERHPGLL